MHNGAEGSGSRSRNIFRERFKLQGPEDVCIRPTSCTCTTLICRTSLSLPCNLTLRYVVNGEEHSSSRLWVRASKSKKQLSTPPGQECPFIPVRHVSPLPLPLPFLSVFFFARLRTHALEACPPCPAATRAAARQEATITRATREEKAIHQTTTKLLLSPSIVFTL